MAGDKESVLVCCVLCAETIEFGLIQVSRPDPASRSLTGKKSRYVILWYSLYSNYWSEMLITKDVNFKLEEASFHIELLYLIQKSRKSLTHIDDPLKEASYLFSAILNAFFSATEILKGKNKPLVAEFKRSHPEIYARAKDGGLRNKTVHTEHVEVKYLNKLPPTRGIVVLRFSESPKLSKGEQSKGVVKLRFERVIYVTINGNSVSAVDFCTIHLSKLKCLADRLLETH